MTLHVKAVLLALSRRRLSLLLLTALPVALFLTQDGVGRSIRALLFGVSWAVSTVAFFTTTSARQVEPRLQLAGRSPTSLVAARLSALVVVALSLVVGYWGLVLVLHQVERPAGVALDFGVTAVLAVAFGSTVGSLVQREMEGILLLFVFAALQAVVDPFGTVAKFLPFWASRELGTWAVDGPDQGSLPAALAHAGLVLVLCALISTATRPRSATRASSR